MLILPLDILGEVVDICCDDFMAFDLLRAKYAGKYQQKNNNSE